MSAEKITFDGILEDVTHRKPMETLVYNRIMQITIHDMDTMHSKLCYLTKDNLYQMLHNFIQRLQENTSGYVMAISYDTPPVKHMCYSGRYIHGDLVRYYFVKNNTGVKLLVNIDPFNVVNLENGIIIQRACSHWMVPVYEISDSDSILVNHKKFMNAMNQFIDGNIDMASYQKFFSEFVEAVKSADERGIR